MISVFVDTNIIVSSVLFPKSITRLALQKAVHFPFILYTSSYCIDELYKVFETKFIDRLGDLSYYLENDIQKIEVIATPEKKVKEEDFIRDEKDKKVIRAAVSLGADILLTGDKDFTESQIENPEILTPRQFLDY